MSGEAPRKQTRLRSGLRRHGLVRRPEVVRALVRSRRLRFTDGNRVEIFDTGREGLGAMLEAVQEARDRIHLETYILRSDPMGRRFVDALVERAKAGVDVRLIYDSVGSRTLDERVLVPLLAAGGEVLAFNPIARFYPRFAPRRRDHRKILVVDGRVAFTGGLNIGEEYSRGIAGSAAEEWRDAHVRLRGPVVRDLEAVFLESWFRGDGRSLPWVALLASEPPEAGDARCAVLPDGPVYKRRRMRDLLVSAVNLGSPGCQGVIEIGGTCPSIVLAPRAGLQPMAVLQNKSAITRRGNRVTCLFIGQGARFFRSVADGQQPPIIAAHFSHGFQDLGQKDVEIAGRSHRRCKPPALRLEPRQLFFRHERAEHHERGTETAQGDPNLVDALGVTAIHGGPFVSQPIAEARTKDLVHGLVDRDIRRQLNFLGLAPGRPAAGHQIVATIGFAACFDVNRIMAVKLQRQFIEGARFALQQFQLNLPRFQSCRPGN